MTQHDDGMSDRWYDGLVIFITDFWWLILAVIVLALTAYFTRGWWLPLLGA